MSSEQARPEGAGLPSRSKQAGSDHLGSRIWVAQLGGLAEGAGPVGIIVAIDGPAGAGKSTVARAVADQLGFVWVDTGAMYRAVTLLAVENSVDVPDELAALAKRLTLRFDGRRVFIQEREVTHDIRSEAVTARVSEVSAVAGVRDALLALQRDLGRAHDNGAVLEGRDIGTVVFPDAEVKVFMTASDEERARRRHAELEQKGQEATLEEVLTRIQTRDALDGGRAVAPLRPAEDAVHLDTTDRTFEQVVGAVVDLVRART